jgi:hypothetical protein
MSYSSAMEDKAILTKLYDIRKKRFARCGPNISMLIFEIKRPISDKAETEFIMNNQQFYDLFIIDWYHSDSIIIQKIDKQLN